MSMRCTSFVPDRAHRSLVDARRQGADPDESRRPLAAGSARRIGRVSPFEEATHERDVVRRKVVPRRFQMRDGDVDE